MLASLRELHLIASRIDLFSQALYFLVQLKSKTEDLFSIRCSFIPVWEYCPHELVAWPGFGLQISIQFRFDRPKFLDKQLLLVVNLWYLLDAFKIGVLDLAALTLDFFDITKCSEES
jgi:hypothetical protein